MYPCRTSVHRSDWKHCFRQVHRFQFVAQQGQCSSFGLWPALATGCASRIGDLAEHSLDIWWGVHWCHYRRIGPSEAWCSSVSRRAETPRSQYDHEQADQEPIHSRVVEKVLLFSSRQPQGDHSRRSFAIWIRFEPPLLGNSRCRCQGGYSSQAITDTWWAFAWRCAIKDTCANVKQGQVRTRYHLNPQRRNRSRTWKTNLFMVDDNLQATIPLAHLAPNFGWFPPSSHANNSRRFALHALAHHSLSLPRRRVASAAVFGALYGLGCWCERWPYHRCGCLQALPTQLTTITCLISFCLNPNRCIYSYDEIQWKNDGATERIELCSRSATYCTLMMIFNNLIVLKQ